MTSRYRGPCRELYRLQIADKWRTACRCGWSGMFDTEPDAERESAAHRHIQEDRRSGREVT